MKQWWFRALALVWALGGVGAAPQAGAQEAAAAPLKLIRIGVATGGAGNPVRFGGSSASIAHAEGLVEEAFRPDGVKVEWIFFKGAGPAVNEALVNQQLDFAYQGDLPSLVHRANGVKTRILLGTGVRSGLFLAVPPESSIRGLEDLKGKKVALFKGTNLHLAAVRALADKGVRERDVRFVNLDFATSHAALVNKDVDAAFGYVGLFDLRDRGLARIVWSAAEDSFKFTRQAALLVTDDFATRHPAAVQRVVTTFVKAAHRYSDESQRAALFDQWGKAEYPAAIWRNEYIGQPLRVRLSPLIDPFLVESYRASARTAEALKLVRGRAQIDGWFDPRFLDAALTELNLKGFWPAYGADGRLLTH
ncbi:ABC transporter substrate-binding protein [Hydrogenophaga sp. NFH-34]|uniref:ABC transporter substrate-binding protein n=1 Tax=Hydrogenophaga sp. NFH-34 TaxID=2744446 RepID=UPI001F29A861|nr:ABC transporter substrate-binding protein [Hydrogenophaga sp. NFH-34]